MKFTRTLLACCALAAVVITYGFSVERYALRINTYPLYFENLPDEFDGYTILMFSDLHYGLFMSEPWVRHVIAMTNNAGADLVVGLGDYVHRRRFTGELTAVWPMLRTLKAKDGVYFVNGNHEHWADSALSLDLLERSGLSLRHRHTLLRRGGAALALAGCGDMRGGDEPGLEKALAGIPAGTFTIVLAHTPDTADLPHGNRVDLFLCGHTHGGQIIVPFLGKPILVPVDNRSYDFGLKRNARHEAVFISRGIGWAILPVRLNCPPELAVVRLLKKGGRAAGLHGRDTMYTENTPLSLRW